MREVIDKYAGLPFEYGADCCTFAGEFLESQRGWNPMAELMYADKSGAYEIIERFGGLDKAITHYLGEPYDGCKDGDICLIDANNGRDAAAVIYNGRVVARVGGGLMDYPLSRAKLVWCT